MPDRTTTEVIGMYWYVKSRDFQGKLYTKECWKNILENKFFLLLYQLSNTVLDEEGLCKMWWIKQMQETLGIISMPLPHLIVEVVDIAETDGYFFFC